MLSPRRFPKNALSGRKAESRRRFVSSSTTAPESVLKSILEKNQNNLEVFYSLSANALGADKKVLRKYNGSLPLLVMKQYPEHRWQPWKFARLPRGYWPALAAKFKAHDQSAEYIVRSYFDQLVADLNLKSTSQLARMKARELGPTARQRIHQLGGLPLILTRLGIEHGGKEVAFFGQVGLAFWDEAPNRRKFLDFILHQLGSQDTAAAYSVNHSVILQAGGSALLRMYNGAAALILMSEYPEHAWEVWKFEKVPKGVWNSELTQRQFVESLRTPGANMTDLYNLTTQVINDNGGRGVLSLFNYSVPALLSALYPQHDWQPWKFSKTPAKYWQQIRQKLSLGNAEARRVAVAYLTDLGQKHTIHSLDDWYRLSTQQIGDGPLSTLKLLGGLRWLLARAYPDHSWDPRKFERRKKGAVQRVTRAKLLSTLPNQRMDCFPAGQRLTNSPKPAVMKER